MKKHDLGTPMLLLVALACLAIIGCTGPLADNFTPAPITKHVLEYTETDPCDIPLWMNYTTLKVLKDQEVSARVKHREEQINLRRLAQDDKRQYTDVINYTTPNIEAVEQIQGTILGATEGAASGLPGGGLLMLALGAAGGGAAGRRYKRPGDKSPAEVEEEIAKVKAGQV